MTDKEIIELFMRRSEQAVEQCYAAYGRACRSVAFGILGSEEDAEEIAWDTMLKAWNSIPPAEPEHLCAYLLRTARNAALDRYRSRSTEKRAAGVIPAAFDELAECLPDVFAAYERDTKEIGMIISCWLRTKPKEKRLAFTARYFLAMPEKETASKLGISVGKLKSMLRRMRLELKEILGEEGYDV